MNEDKFTEKSYIYDKYRPKYPSDLFKYLYSMEGFSEKSVIADVGAGTGIFSEPLLKRKSKVILVEPNYNMLQEAKRKLYIYRNATFLECNAENIKVASHSLDFITVAQAFHWFNMEKFKSECKRLLKDRGKVLLTWNITDSSTNLSKDLTSLNNLYINNYSYNNRDSENLDCYSKFFKIYNLFYYDNDLELTRDEFIGRCLSRSYSPNINDDIYNEYIAGLMDIFYKNSEHEKIIIKNKTRSMIGFVR